MSLKGLLRFNNAAGVEYLLLWNTSTSNLKGMVSTLPRRLLELPRPTKQSLDALASQIEAYSRKVDKLASLLLKVLTSTPIDPNLREKIVEELRRLGYD